MIVFYRILFLTIKNMAPWENPSMNNGNDIIKKTPENNENSINDFNKNSEKLNNIASIKELDNALENFDWYWVKELFSKLENTNDDLYDKTLKSMIEKWISPTKLEIWGQRSTVFKVKNIDWTMDSFNISNIWNINFAKLQNMDKETFIQLPKIFKDYNEIMDFIQNPDKYYNAWKSEPERKVNTSQVIDIKLPEKKLSTEKNETFNETINELVLKLSPSDKEDFLSYYNDK